MGDSCVIGGGVWIFSGYFQEPNIMFVLLCSTWTKIIRKKQKGLDFLQEQTPPRGTMSAISAKSNICQKGKNGKIIVPAMGAIRGG